jgi:hypothetical protein
MKLEKKISLNWKKNPVGFKLGKKNPVHQTGYFKLENWKIEGECLVYSFF